jgi:hypothetical protein
VHFYEEVLPDRCAVVYLTDNIEVLLALAWPPGRDKEMVCRLLVSEYYFPDNLGFQLSLRKFIQRSVDYKRGSEEDQRNARKSEYAPRRPPALAARLSTMLSRKTLQGRR